MNFDTSDLAPADTHRGLRALLGVEETNPWHELKRPPDTLLTQAHSR
jgi:hypothetical protein